MSERDSYTVDTNNIIRNPGKFEGEHISVPYFWDEVLTGTTDDVYIGETPYSFIAIEPSDRAKFPDLTEYGLILHESEQGFVSATWFDTQELFEQAYAAYSAESEDDENEDED